VRDEGQNENMRLRFLPSLLLVSALLVIGVASSFAQMNTGEISGTVIDPANAIIEGAEVAAVNSETQQKFTAATNEQGQYLLPQLPPGMYTVTASMQGFKQGVAERIALHLNERLRQDFALELGDARESVVVQLVPGLVQTESAEIKDVIQNQQVVDLPLKDREFLQLTVLSEGVVNPPGGTRGDSLQQTGTLVNVLGQRTGHNLFLVDGVSVTDEYFNNVVLNPSPDATAEFIIDKTNYGAEFGGKSGAVINVVTKSGGDQLHGSAYEFLRNNIFNAKNFFDLPGPTPAFRENQFGGAVGGPILKGRTFFFVNYDGQRTRRSLAHLFSVPTMAERAGNFAGSAAIFNPLTHLPIPGNNINNDPALRLDSAAVALLAKLPPPTSGLAGANNLLAVEKQRYDNNEYNARLDHRFSDRDNSFLRASVFEANQFDPFGSSVLNEALLPGFGRGLSTHSVNLAAAETHTFSPNLVNEFRFGWLRVSGGQSDPNAGNPFALQYGLAGVTPNPAEMGYPQISLSNAFSAIGSPAGFTSRTDRDFEFFDNLLMHRGRNNLHFGGYFFHLGFNPSFPNDARGVYTYSGAYTANSPATGNPLADFLLGYPSQAQVGIGSGGENARTNWAHFYAEDNWQATPTLTVNAGLRYEYNANLVARPNQTANINLSGPGGPAFVAAADPGNLPASAAQLATLSPLPIVSAASVGWDDSLIAPRYLRLSPRLGLAWRIPGSQEMVVRAGFGIYTNQAAYSVLQNLAENMPFFLVKTVSNSSAPSLTTENILAQSPTGAIGANAVNHDYRIEYNEVWNLSVQRAVTPNTSVQAEYIGSRTVHADSAATANFPLPAPGAIQARRPFPNLAAFTSIRWDGWATFHALTLKATRRFSSGLSFDADYTFSKSLDDASDAGTTNAEYNLPQSVYAPGLEAGPSSFDHRHRMTANVVYDFPFARDAAGWRYRLLGEWRGSGILIIQSGAPFTVNLSSAEDVANIGLINAMNVERPNLLANPNDGPKSPAAWFNTTAFALPAPFTFGNSGRNIVVGPDLANLDLSLQKKWSLRENRALEFRADAFNALNHPNFNLPGRIFGAANFGVITSAQDARELQFALKWVF
jgi:Carboxypeptidase regulatory-like domain